MAKKRFTEEQIVAILREAEKSPTNEEILRKHARCTSSQIYLCRRWYIYEIAIIILQIMLSK
jgi:hypothetical protein